MAFDKKTLNDIRLEIAALDETIAEIRDLFVSHPYKTEIASEYAIQGVLRRLKTIERCIRTVFKKLPPSRRKPPSIGNLHDSEIYIQSFVLNISGCLDNLAWIWVKETGLKKGSGNDLARGDIGLRKKHTLIRKSLSPGFGAYLDQIEGWLAANEDYRDSLAHRIPLYIPPYSILIDKLDDHKRIERSILVADLINLEDNVKKLTADRDRLRFFQPVIMHSFSESARPIVFRAQMIADVKTLKELATKLFDDLASFPARP